MSNAYAQPVARLARTVGQALISFANDVQNISSGSARDVSTRETPGGLGARQRRVVEVLRMKPDTWMTTREISLAAGDEDVPNTHTTLKRLLSLGVVALQEPPQRWRLTERYRTPPNA